MKNHWKFKSKIDTQSHDPELKVSFVDEFDSVSTEVKSLAITKREFSSRFFLDSNNSTVVQIKFHQQDEKTNTISRSEQRYSLQKSLWPKLAQYKVERVVFLAIQDSEYLQQVSLDAAANFYDPFFEKPRVDFEAQNIFTTPLSQVKATLNLGFRRWINLNPSDLTSLAIGKSMKDFCGENECAFTSFDEKQLSKMGMNLLVAVGQASRRSPPRLHIAEYTPKDAIGEPLVLVGKGITFDTGGINLKHHNSWVNTMKNDMGGAALMWHCFQYLVLSKVKRPVKVIIPTCENAIDAESIQPGSILKSHKGLSVIIEHTDCEGRLILADALSYANEKFKPERIYTSATLTGGSLIQFTNFFTPIHFASDQEQTRIQNIAEQLGEEFSFWPYREWYLDANKHAAADLTNMGRMPAASGGSGSSNVAAHFLSKFSNCPIVHSDIFCSTWNWGANYPGAVYGATGAPFHTMSEFFRKECET